MWFAYSETFNSVTKKKRGMQARTGDLDIRRHAEDVEATEGHEHCTGRDSHPCEDQSNTRRLYAKEFPIRVLWSK